MKMYGMAGTFFQAGQGLAIVHAAESEGGTHVEVAQQAMSHAFSGHFALEEEPDFGGFGEGVLIDEYAHHTFWWNS